MTDYNELVRRGECKFWNETEKGFGRCLKSGFQTPKDFLGEDGERKDHGMTDYSELVNALRCIGECHEGCPYRTSEGNCSAHSAQLEQDAAAAIEALQAEVEKHRAAWAKLAKDIDYTVTYGHKPNEPKQGEWELIDGAEPMRWGCSRCKYMSWETSNYCPRCGAKMEVQTK